MTSSSIKISNQQFDFVTGLDSYSFFRTFPDWLSISFPCSQTPLLGVLDLLGKKSPFQVKPRGKSKTLYMFDNGGTLFVTEEATYQNLSFSGQLLAMLRDSHLDAEFITLLRSHPHNVTRLDVALDVPLAGSSVIRSLRAKFPDGVADIAGRSRRLRFQTCSDYYDPRLETGTVYFQTRTYGGYVKLKVYDKIHQLLDENPLLKSFLEGKKHTRYEFTISKGASLDDYARPDSVFWHYMPCDVLKRPESLSVAPWKPSERIEYDDVSVNPVTDYQRLKFLLEDSSVLRMLVEQVSSVNGGASLLHRTIDSLLSQNGDTPL